MNSDRQTIGNSTKISGTPLVSVPAASDTQNNRATPTETLARGAAPPGSSAGGGSPCPEDRANERSGRYSDRGTGDARGTAGPAASQACHAQAMQMLMNKSIVASAVARRDSITNTALEPRMIAARMPVTRPKREPTMK